MLARPPHRWATTITRRSQAGMVMIVALIILVAMTLGGLALMRSMDTSNLIAGNMAFQQAATHSADAGVEAAIAWLETTNIAAARNLDSSVPAAGYAASTNNVAANQTGETFWNSLSAFGVCFLPVINGACSVTPGVANTAGNKIGFMIQRLCNGAGTTTGNGCSISPGAAAPSDNSGESLEAGGEILSQTGVNSAVYYRITVRVSGPRNTVSFVQAVVSM
jgi:type IV pilus assembly protein PilX